MSDRITLEKRELSSLGGSHLLQSGFWGEFKGKQGWEPLALGYIWQGRECELLILVKRFFKILPMAYVPFGPDLSGDDDSDHLRMLGEALITELPMGTLFVRFDLTGYRDDTQQTPMPKEGLLKKSSVDIQPPDTVILDITPTQEEIMAGMHKKWRYNINLATKKGVVVINSSSKLLEKWYDLYRVTGERDKIAIHPMSYYQRLFDMAEQSENAPQMGLYLAYHEEELLAGIITSFYKGRATYLYGASSNSKRNLMPAYALQWEAIKASKEAGCSEYDFFGIPPTDDPNHPMHGLYRFKTNFGGEVRHYWGSWDRVYGKLFYLFYSLAERARQWYFKKFKKR